MTTSSEMTIGHKDLLAQGYSELTRVTKKGKETVHSGVYARFLDNNKTIEFAFYDGDNFTPNGDSMRSPAQVSGYEFALADGSKALLTSLWVKVLGQEDKTIRPGQVFNANITSIAKNAYSVKVSLANSKRYVSESSGKVYAAFAHNQPLRGSNAIWSLFLDTGKVEPIVKVVEARTTRTFTPTVPQLFPTPSQASAVLDKAGIAPAPVKIGQVTRSQEYLDKLDGKTAPVAPAPKMSVAEKLEIVRALAMVQAEYPTLTLEQVEAIARKVGLI